MLKKEKRNGQERTEHDKRIKERLADMEYQGMKITQLDMTGLRNMTGRDLNMVYDLYMAQGGGGVAMQESTLLFAQVVASRVCGYPIEAIMELKAKDSVYLKNRVYRFFFLSE